MILEEMIQTISPIIWRDCKNTVVNLCPDPKCLRVVALSTMVSEEDTMFVAKAMIVHGMAGTLQEARKIIMQQGVKVNGIVVTKSTERLKKGDKLEVGNTRSAVVEQTS